ncbi:glutamate racemase [Treponema sp.]|uniref:glutamate racemase n=1 Tax=Treponema sp. TaxID=166 RepID=UPI003F0A2A60
MKDRIDFAFLDSGTGGIPYMLSLKKKSPDSRCVYLGDTFHFPYGEKTSEEVTFCASKAIQKILDLWNPRLVVIACNTMSVTALDQLRKNFPGLPLVGTVPAVKLAAKVTENKRIGLLATNATVNHPYCRRLISEFASGCTVFNRGDPELIRFIEQDLFYASREERESAVKPAVEFFCSCGCDTIILGCTHFTHMSEDIQRCFSASSEKKVFVVDSRDGVSNHALNVLSASSGTGNSEPLLPLPPDMSFFVTSIGSKACQKEYETLCRNFNIPFGGLLEF